MSTVTKFSQQTLLSDYQENMTENRREYPPRSLERGDGYLEAPHQRGPWISSIQVNVSKSSVFYLAFDRYLDLFHIMAYDFHGKWERQTGHNAPLNAPLADPAYRRRLAVNASVRMWIEMGAPTHKIVLG